MNPSTTLFVSSDGSLSAFNEEFGECYSSRSEGALSEKIAKHIAPAFEYLRSKIFKHSQAKIPHNAQSDIWILDICFGLGYNAFLSASAFEYLLAQNPLAKNLHIISLEKDRATLDLARQIWHLDNDKWQSLASGQTTRLSQNTSLTIIWGDASKVLENLARDFATKDFSKDFARDFAGDFVDDFAGDFTQYFAEVFARDFAGFDIIYQDPFSFSKNPALWSEEHFKYLFAISKSTCLITSYATRKEVLANAQKAGFLAHKLKGDFRYLEILQEILQAISQAILPFLKHAIKCEHSIKIAGKISSEAKSPPKHQAKSRESSLFSKQEICLPNARNHTNHTKLSTQNHTNNKESI